MGKHETSYPRVERDHYPTPSWVVDALAEHVDLVGKVVWECAAGAGQMAEALKAAGAAKVCSTDVVERSSPRDAVFDFLFLRDPGPRCDLIATNPPLGPGGKLAAAFVARGLEQPRTGKAWPCCCRPISTAARPSPNSSTIAAPSSARSCSRGASCGSGAPMESKRRRGKTPPDSCGLGMRFAFTQSCTHRG